MIIWSFNGALWAVSKEMDMPLKSRVNECVEWKKFIIFVIFHITIVHIERNNCD
jgi:hypothetical protein